MPTVSKSPTLPNLDNTAQIQQTMQVWRNNLRRTLAIAPAPQPPANFRVTSARGGLQLIWSPTRNVRAQATTLGQGSQVNGPDGYEILVSKSGTFTHDLEVYSLNDNTQTTFFYPTPAPTSISVRMHTTAGTAANPQSIFGPDTATLRHTSIDSTDKVTKSITKVDVGTSDVVRAAARRGRYQNQYLNKTYS
jgi:hypothetical protein